MNKASRHICLAVLCGLLIGHASVAVHIATHVSSDAAHCDLCNSYGNSSEALTGGHDPGVPRFQEIREPVRTVRHTGPRILFPVRQRGPPGTN